MWVLSDSATGYVYKFKIYTGKEDDISHGLAYSVVTGLMSELKRKGYHLYMDNYYTSPKLVKDLFEDGIYSSGTVRSNRKHFPPELKPKKGQSMVRGDMEVLYHDYITAVHWMDKRDVLMLSTIYQDETVNVDRRSGHSMLSVSCPKIVQDYNAHMGGVDVADQHMMYYSCGRKIMKYWRRITWRLLDQVVLNSHILYNNIQQSKCKSSVSQKEFRIMLSYALAAPLQYQLQSVGRPPKDRSLNRLKGKHFPSKKHPRKRCIVCSKKRTPEGKYKDTKTNSYCDKCNVYVCTGQCFRCYHTMLKY